MKKPANQIKRQNPTIRKNSKPKKLLKEELSLPIFSNPQEKLNY